MKKVVPMRIPVYLETEIVSEGKKYPGVIGNLSEKGAFVEVNPVNSAMPFLPGKKVLLNFRTAPKKDIKLDCEVVWLYAKKSDSKTMLNSMGVELKTAPQKYKKFFNTL